MRVLDLSRLVSGPFATRELVDLGADVIELESPESSATRAGFGAGDLEVAARRSFVQLHRDRRSIVVDVKADGGSALV